MAGSRTTGAGAVPCAPATQQGITNEDWFRVGGGDGFYTQIDPNDPTTVYVESQNGNLRRLDLESLETKNIRPEPDEGETRYRFDWNSPVLISPHDSTTIYYGGNRLFTSKNRGDVWTAKRGSDEEHGPRRDADHGGDAKRRDSVAKRRDLELRPNHLH